MKNRVDWITVAIVSSIPTGFFGTLILMEAFVR